MLSSPDPLSILGRGMILIDLALEDLLNSFSALPYKKLDESLNHPTLMQKATVACALGAISEGELNCIREINSLRNKLAHRLAANIVQEDEARIVNVFRGQTKLFSGLDYDSKAYPRTFVFLMLVLFHFMSLRCQRSDVKLVHLRDDGNVEAVAAISLTTSMIDIMKKNAEANDKEIMVIVERHADKARRLREGHND
jgi:hypothetical protein